MYCDRFSMSASDKVAATDVMLGGCGIKRDSAAAMTIDINAASLGLNMSISYTFHSAGDRAAIEPYRVLGPWPIKNECKKLAVFAAGINVRARSGLTKL